MKGKQNVIDYDVDDATTNYMVAYPKHKDIENYNRNHDYDDCDYTNADIYNEIVFKRNLCTDNQMVQIKGIT